MNAKFQLVASLFGESKKKEGGGGIGGGGGGGGGGGIGGGEIRQLCEISPTVSFAKICEISPTARFAMTAVAMLASRRLANRGRQSTKKDGVGGGLSISPLLGFSTLVLFSTGTVAQGESCFASC